MRDRQERFLPEMSKIMEECVGVRQDENGVISVVNEDAKWILVSMDQKAHKSNEQTIWYIINNSILLMGEGGHDH